MPHVCFLFYISQRFIPELLQRYGTVNMITFFTDLPKAILLRPFNGLRRFGPLFLILALLISFFVFTGCASSKNKHEPEFEKEKEESVFDKESENQNELAKFAASAGRKDPNEKKKVSKGQTFLLSDKAREIYENTER